VLIAQSYQFIAADIVCLCIYFDFAKWTFSITSICWSKIYC